jgi:hypothetical protein
VNIQYYHASKFGNGGMIAEEFKRQMAVKGINVNILHVKNANPNEIPMSDLYVFSSPGRFGKPIGDMQHFLKQARLSAGMKYAVLATEFAPKPDAVKRIPTEEEIGKCQRILPVMNEILLAKGLIKVAETKIFVTGLKGPLENNWQTVVSEFISHIPISDIACSQVIFDTNPVMSLA